MCNLCLEKSLFLPTTSPSTQSSLTTKQTAADNCYKPYPYNQMNELESKEITELQDLILTNEPKEIGYTYLNDYDEHDESSNNGSDTNHFIVVEGALGVNVGSLPYLTRVFTKEWLDIKRKGKALAINNDAIADADDDHDSINIMRVTSCLLLLTTDSTTLWNDRKVRILSVLNSTNSTNATAANDRKRRVIEGEFYLVNLCLTKSSKASSAWYHLKFLWPFYVALLNNEENESEVYDFCIGELKLCEKIVKLAPKNYYAWTYRAFIVDRFMGINNNNEGENENDGDKDNYKHCASSFLEIEMKWTYKWLTVNVSDHSAASYFNFVIDKLTSATLTLIIAQTRQEANAMMMRKRLTDSLLEMKLKFDELSVGVVSCEVISVVLNVLYVNIIKLIEYSNGNRLFLIQEGRELIAYLKSKVEVKVKVKVNEHDDTQMMRKIKSFSFAFFKYSRMTRNDGMEGGRCAEDGEMISIMKEVLVYFKDLDSGNSGVFSVIEAEVKEKEMLLVMR